LVGAPAAAGRTPFVAWTKPTPVVPPVRNLPFFSGFVVHSEASSGGIRAGGRAKGSFTWIRPAVRRRPCLTCPVMS